jgi:hypothetical protein
MSAVQQQEISTTLNTQSQKDGHTNEQSNSTQTTQEDFILLIQTLLLEQGWVKRSDNPDDEIPMTTQIPPQPLLIFQKQVANFMRGSRSQVYFPEHEFFDKSRFYKLPGREISLTYPVRNGIWFPGLSYTWKFNFENKRFACFKDSGSNYGARRDKEFKTYEEFYEDITHRIINLIE